MVQKDVIIGWTGTGERVDEETISNIIFPLNSPSIFKTLYDTKCHYIGAISSTIVNDNFIKWIGGGKPKSAFIIPILFKGKIVNIIYGDNGEGENTTTDIGDLLILAQHIPLAFENLVTLRKKMFKTA